MVLPNSLDFAGISGTVVEIIDVHRHAAEKLHAMTRKFGDRENSRVRDLVDVVILLEHDLLDPIKLAAAVQQVWSERETITPPSVFPVLPESWPSRYEQMAAEYDLRTLSYTESAALIARFWAEAVRHLS